MSRKEVDLFVPGRLCLFGEHTDWAGMYRSVNSALEKGEAIVTGIEQGIYAKAERCEKFIVTSPLAFYRGEHLECEMNSEQLLAIAQKGGFFSYVAGVASYINDNYSVGGVRIIVTAMDLPLKSGLSSSAAICVLVARAFNQLYGLKMNVQGEMQAAFRGEQRTPSRCGRLDQACAYGVKPVRMEFDGVEINSQELHVGTTFHWVIANLMSHKDTIRILADLNKAYPFAESERERSVQEALGVDNRTLNRSVIKALEDGDARTLGKLMCEAQKTFDRKVAPSCEELKAPVLHSVLEDPQIQQWIYGGKGVGSQGDGTVQFLAKSAEDADALQTYLEDVRKMPSFRLTLQPGQRVKRAILPLAGFGTRVYPATKNMKKCFLPVLDQDGILKPALLIMLENLLDAGIEEVALIIGEEDREEFERFFAPLAEEHKNKLPADKLAYEEKIEKMRARITYIVQKERLGFGHAVWLARSFTQNEPVLLMLGDFLYKAEPGEENCCKQVMDAFKECGRTLVSIHEIPLDKVVHYGVLHGTWTSSSDPDDPMFERMMTVDVMKEKPTDDYAEQYLGVRNARKEKEYYATFGQYVLTASVFEELDAEIRGNQSAEEGGCEFGLTQALQKVIQKEGMYGFVPRGQCFDIGLPEEYRRTMLEYGK